MEPSEFEKIIGDFEKKLQPVTAEMMAVAGVEPGELPGATAAEVAEVTPPEEKEEACITKGFKNAVGAFSTDFIGKNGQDIKELVMVFLDSLPECEE